MTRILMIASAVVLGLLGVTCTFAPDLVLARIGAATSPGAEIIVQITGALYLGFAMLNWMGKGNLIGGIYGRPVALGNFVHFFVAGIALFKAASHLPAPAVSWSIAAVYGVLAAAFGYVMFGRNPVSAA